MLKSAAALTVVIGLIAGSAYGVTASLTPVGVLTPAEGGTFGSVVNAISGDGAYAVGWSNAPDSTGTTTLHQPFIWSAATGIVRLGAASATDSEARGVVVRTNQGKIGVGGWAAGAAGTAGLQTYEAPLSSLGSGAWTTSGYPGSETGQYNASRLRASSGATEGWYTGGKRYLTARALLWGVGATSSDYRTGGGNAWANSVSETSPTGVTCAAGYDLGNGGSRRAMYMNAPGGSLQVTIPGTAAILSEAFGISVGGTKVSGYDTTADGNINPWMWTVGDAAITVLGRLPGDTKGAAIAINNAGMVAGYSSDGTTADEQAVIWDNTGVWDATGQPINVRSRLAAAGLDVTAWSSFSRITSISNDGSIIGGYGVWAADGSTRGFIATAPEPASLILLGLGGLFLRRRSA